MRRLLLLAGIATLAYVAYRRTTTLQRVGRRKRVPEGRMEPARPEEALYPEQPGPPEPGGPIPRSAGVPMDPQGLTGGEIQEGVWPGQAEALVRNRYPSITDEDLATAGNDLEKLAAIIAERTHQPFPDVYNDLLAAAREASPLDQDEQAL